MNLIEEFAIKKECRLIKLDTFSFQAPNFYKKHGYKVIGVSEDYPKGHNHYYLEKRL
ncbi:ribosomal protein S18 acetylase RimI-like enzyme [Bacillus sp. RC206]